VQPCNEHVSSYWHSTR